MRRQQTTLLLFKFMLKLCTICTIVVFILTQNKIYGQYYGYQTYKLRTENTSKGLKQSEVYKIPKDLNNSDSSYSKRAIKKAVKRSIDNLDNLLLKLQYQSENNFRAKRLEIDSLLYKKYTNSDNINFKDSIQKVIDSLNIKLHESTIDKTMQRVFKQQKSQYEYTLDRTQYVDFFPVRNALTAKSYYKNSDTIVKAKNGLFYFDYAYLNYLSNSKKLAGYTEVLADYVGPVRTSVGILMLAPSSKDSAVTTATSDSIFNRKLFQDRFKSGGGHIQLNTVYPLVQIQDAKFFDFKAILSPKFCIDVPKEDTSVQRFATNTQLALDLRLQINPLNRSFTFLFCFRGMQGWGNSTFYDNMNFKGNERKSFNFNTYTVGFIAKEQLSVYYTWYSGDSRAVNQVGQSNNNSLTVNYHFND